MKTSRPCLWSAVLIAALLLLPGAALGKTGYEVQRPSVNLEMSLRGTHGYRITIRSLERGLILLSASKGGVYAQYSVAGRASRHGIKADFGDLGHIAVRFHGSPRPHADPFPPLKCTTGRPPTYEAGAFEGIIRFHGEQNFTSASASRARGTVLRSFKRTCKRPAWSPQKGSPGEAGQNQPQRSSATILLAASRTEGRGTYLMFVGDENPSADSRHPSTSIVLAGQDERREGITISRSAFTLADRGSVLESAPGVEPVSATVTLPKPFSGSASYGETAGAPSSWTGSLAVPLPGAGTVPLTGAGFEAALCHPQAPAKVKACLKDVAAKLGPAILFFSFGP